MRNLWLMDMQLVWVVTLTFWVYHQCGSWNSLLDFWLIPHRQNCRNYPVCGPLSYTSFSAILNSFPWDWDHNLDFVKAWAIYKKINFYKCIYKLYFSCQYRTHFTVDNDTFLPSLHSSSQGLLLFSGVDLHISHQNIS